MNGPPMSRQTADEVLAGLGAAHDRIAAAMYGIDTHPGLSFLNAGGLAGQTADRAGMLRAELDALWAQFTALGESLERARDLRGRHGDPLALAELTALLRDPVVALDDGGLPVVAAAPGAIRLGLWDLAQRLERRATGMAAHLADVNAAWTSVAARVAPMTEAFDALAVTAETLGPAEVEALRPLGADIGQVRERGLADPLSVAPGGRIAAPEQARYQEITDRLEEQKARLADLVRLRDGYPQRIAALRSLIDEVAAAEQRVARAYARAIDKIAMPGLPPLPRSAALLRSRVPDPGAAPDEGWSRLADNLTLLEQSAHRAAVHAAGLAAAADGLLARRDELRGRLSAYQAKAASRGFAEDERLAARYARAHEILHTAPCDLRAATRAVFAYQTTLDDLFNRSGERRELP